MLRFMQVGSLSCYNAAIDDLSCVHTAPGRLQLVVWSLILQMRSQCGCKVQAEAAAHHTGHLHTDLGD